jgi:hypothetical protein
MGRPTARRVGGPLRTFFPIQLGHCLTTMGHHACYASSVLLGQHTTPLRGSHDASVRAQLGKVRLATNHRSWTAGALVNRVVARPDKPVCLMDGDMSRFGQVVARYSGPALFE